MRILYFFLSILLLCTSATKGQNAIDKIAPVFFENAAQTQKVRAFLWLEQAENIMVSHTETKIEKGARVFTQLQQHAQHSQSAIIQHLQSKAIQNYKPFWVVNTIWVETDLSTLLELAKHPEVLKILPDLPIRYHEPVRSFEPIVSRGPDVEWGIQHINAVEVWNAGIRGAGVVVGGQDTGYDWQHPDLKNQYRGMDGGAISHDYNWHDAIHFSHFLNADTLNDCGFDVLEPCDDSQHGTHTMGTMVGANGIGVAPDAQWIGCRNMEDGWGTPSTYLECFQWFLAPTDLNNDNPDPSKAPHVINNSWGCPFIEGCSEANFETMRQAVANLKASGVFVVVSAGNDGPNCETVRNPAAIFGESFSIGASTPEDTIIYFSSRGSVRTDSSGRMKPDVVAPGVGVRSCIPGGGYNSSNGTSMAGPHVAGVVALLIAADPDLAGQVERLEELLKETAVPIYTKQSCNGVSGQEIPNNTAGYGRVDAWAALRFVRPDLTGDDSIDDSGLLVFPNPFDETLTVSTQETVGAAHIQLFTQLGQLVYDYKVDMFNIHTFYVSHLPKGTYLLKLESDKLCISKKVIK